MNRIECFITAHIGDPINECDDNFAFNLNKCNFAIADGSSSDFFSKIYSRMLVDNFVEDPNVFYNEENVKRINSEWRSVVKEKLDEAGCKQGSFPYVRFQKMDPGCSTLIGLNFFKEEGEIKYRCSGLGDSVLFFKPEDSDIPTLQFSSYSNAEFSLDQNVEFGYTPIISRSYSTQWIENIKEYSAYLSKGVFYLMTDGMAEWILRPDNGTIIEKFLELDNIHSQEDFLVYVASIRKLGAHNDDMTLLKIYIDEVSMDFDSQKSVAFDYRAEQDEIENEEAQNRVLKRLEEERKASQEKQNISTSNSLDWITNVVSAQKKRQENKQETEKVQQRVLLDERGKTVLLAAQAKVKGEKVTSNDVSEKQEQIIVEQQGDVQEAIAQTKEQCAIEQQEAVQEAIAQTKEQCAIEQQEAVQEAIAQTKEQCAIEQQEAVQKAIAQTKEQCAIEQQGAVQEAIAQTKEQCAIEQQEAVQEAIAQTKEQCVIEQQEAVQEAVNNANNKKDEEDKLSKQREDAKKKQITFRLKKNYKWIIIIVLILSNIYFSLDHVTKTTDLTLLQNELSNLKELHNADSVKIVKLSSDIKNEMKKFQN